LNDRSALVDVTFAVESAAFPDGGDIVNWVRGALHGAGYLGRGEVSVRVVDVAEMQALNRDYRSKDAPTNVLSFPAGDIDGLPDDEPESLGDIVVCAAVLSDEALAQDKQLHDHWAHILVHGTLHLLGYDHEVEADADAMEKLEVRILSTYDVADPYRV
jgi:probable rRNA maturation factor